MSETTRKRLLYVLLGAAVIWGVWNIETEKQVRKKSNPTTLSPALVSQTNVDQDQPAIDIDSHLARNWAGDPFRVRKQTKAVTSQPKPVYNLSGIVYNDQRPLAIINNRTVSVGDKINGATVVEILKKEVTLSREGNRFTVIVRDRG